MTESEMYHRIKSLLIGEPIKLQRIEVQCVPDLYFRHALLGGWMEFKISTEGRDGSATVPFRPGQFPWIKDEIKHGGKVILVLYVQGRVAFLHDHEIQLQVTLESRPGQWLWWSTLTKAQVMKGMKIW